MDNYDGYKMHCVIYIEKMFFPEVYVQYQYELNKQL